MNDFISKPVTLENLFLTIDNVLSRTKNDDVANSKYANGNKIDVIKFYNMIEELLKEENLSEIEHLSTN